MQMAYKLTYDDNSVVITKYSPDGSDDSIILIPTQISGRNVVGIGDMAFAYANGITKIIIPNSVRFIGKNAFFYCEDLIEVVIPNSVEEIGSFAFGGCEKLVKTNLSTKMEIISKYTFTGCWALEPVIIPSNILRIGEGAFSNCKNFRHKNIVIGKHVKIIDNKAFDGISGLRVFTDNESMPDKWVKFNDNDYERNIKFGYHYFESNEEYDYFVNQSNEIGIIKYKGSKESLSVPNTINEKKVVEIEELAFFDNEVLIRVSLPENLKVICFHAFNSQRIRKVFIPSTVNEIVYWSHSKPIEVYTNASAIPSKWNFNSWYTKIEFRLNKSLDDFQRSNEGE